MKNLIAKLVVVGVAMLGVPAFVQADDNLISKDQMERRLQMQKTRAETLKRMEAYRKQMGADETLRKQGVPEVATVPELDPGSMGSALALLMGGTAVVLGRRRRLAL